MPFMGQDWRDPGECWIKTDLGWEPARLHDLWSATVKIPQLSYNGSALAPIAPAPTPPPSLATAAVLDYATAAAVVNTDDAPCVAYEFEVNGVMPTDRAVLNVSTIAKAFDNRSYASVAAASSPAKSAPRNIIFQPKRLFDIPPSAKLLSKSSPASTTQQQQKETPRFLRDIETFNWRNRNTNNRRDATPAVPVTSKPPKAPHQQQPVAAGRPRSTRMSLLIKRAEGFDVPDELLSSSDEDSSLSSNMSSNSYSACSNKENMMEISSATDGSREASVEKCSFPTTTTTTKKRTCSQTSLDSQHQSTSKQLHGSVPSTSSSPNDSASAVQIYQPYCYVVVRTTRERAGYTSIADAFCRLDFAGAAKDIRRFHYVCKVLDLLISQRLEKLGGQAQKYLFKTVEHVIEQVFSSEQNLDSLRQLLAQLDQAIHDSKYWGNYVGSSGLWARHRVVLQEWIAKVQRLQLKGRSDDNRAMLHDLPAECLRLVLLFLTDHRDVLSASEADPVGFARFADERHLWYDLCWFHFKPYQLAAALKQQGKRLTESHDINARQNDWKALYYKLKRIHGLRESYAETIILCTHCKCLFWQDWGHPCILQNDQRRAARAVPLAPSAFVDLFAL